MDAAELLDDLMRVDEGSARSRLEAALRQAEERGRQSVRADVERLANEYLRGGLPDHAHALRVLLFDVWGKPLTHSNTPPAQRGQTR